MELNDEVRERERSRGGQGATEGGREPEGTQLERFCGHWKLQPELRRDI